STGPHGSAGPGAAWPAPVRMDGAAAEPVVLPHTDPAMWQSRTQVSATMDESTQHFFVTALAARSRVDLGEVWRGQPAASSARDGGSHHRTWFVLLERETAGFAHEDSFSEVDPDGWSSGGSARDSARRDHEAPGRLERRRPASSGAG